VSSERIKAVRDALLHARILLPHYEPHSKRGEIARALVAALDALTDEVEGLGMLVGCALQQRADP
jgi:hypothetical protein